MSKKLSLPWFLTCRSNAKNRNNCFFFLLFLFLVSSTNFVTAQSSRSGTIRVKGVVTEKATGQGLAGVTVKVKGGTAGTATDNSGAFVVDVPSNASLVISYVGFNDQEVSVKNNQTVNVELERGSSSLNEVVVVVYYQR